MWPGRLLQIGVVALSVTVAGCVASFEAGAQTMRDANGDLGAGFTGGGSLGVVLPRGAILLGVHTRLGASTARGETGELIGYELRWHDSPGTWSPRVGLGIGVAIPYHAYDPGLGTLTAWGTVGLARELYRTPGSYVAASLDLLAGYAFDTGLFDDRHGPVALLALTVVLESWPKRPYRSREWPPEMRSRQRLHHDR